MFKLILIPKDVSMYYFIAFLCGSTIRYLIETCFVMNHEKIDSVSDSLTANVDGGAMGLIRVVAYE